MGRLMTERVGPKPGPEKVDVKGESSDLYPPERGREQKDRSGLDGRRAVWSVVGSSLGRGPAENTAPTGDHRYDPGGVRRDG